MKQLKVWAPKSNRVHLRLDGKDTPMQRGARGWWELAVANTETLQYQFVLDGQALPDPRSPFQPHGIHGPSQTVDHDRFEWTDGEWQAPPLSAAVIYELHIGTFTPEGTLDAAAAKLGHLKSLGVTHVEVMPVNQFSGPHGWGYDGWICSPSITHTVVRTL